MADDPAPEALPFPLYLTHDLPGVGGEWKQTPEDFLVEEIPAYLPSGEGEHLFLWIEKRDLSGEMLLSRISRGLNIPSSEIGMAGIKDRRAVTRQWVSVPAKAEGMVTSLESDDLRVLEAKRHRNKLKTGHLHGNRFTAMLRGVRNDPVLIEAIAHRLRTAGCPNYYGEQRFGHDQGTLALGEQLLRGEKTPADLPPARRRFLLRMALSAVQSQLFNHVLAERLADGLFSQVMRGDLMEVLPAGGKFIVADPEVEQSRFNQQETSITGPMFGMKMRAPEGVPLERERRILARSGFGIEAFAPYASLMEGARRALRFLPHGLTCELWDESDSPPADLSTNHSRSTSLRVSVELPAGAYLTVLLREFQKPEPQRGGTLHESDTLDEAE
ncbi:MAG: tRNA pseudouridine(13) synthase TruD [Planctomyces sp.]|nr:tRNA pseudouridine(13) synthase TruD [Planctomyces sp.]